MQPLMIGDELTAAAYRLAGFAVQSPGPAAAADVFDQALIEKPPLILLTAEYAAHLEPQCLALAQARFAPPVCLVPDVAGRVPMPDLAQHIREVLGIAA